MAETCLPQRRGLVDIDLRLVTKPGECVSGARGVLRRDLDSHGASDGVVARRKTADPNQILESFAVDDVPNLLGFQDCFRDCEQDGVGGAKHDVEFVVQMKLEML